MEKIYEDILCKAVDDYIELAYLAGGVGGETTPEQIVEIHVEEFGIKGDSDIDYYLLGFFLARTSPREAKESLLDNKGAISTMAFKLRLERGFE